MFDPNKIEDLQFSTEKQIIDRKFARIKTVDLAIPIVAMANADGDYLAISDDGAITGIDAHEKNLNKMLRAPYRMLQEVNGLICTVNDCKYHYVQRQDSLSKQHTMRYLVDYWTAHYERYNSLVNNADESSKTELLRCCTSAVARTWAYCCDSPKADREQYREAIKKMNAFTRKHIPLFGFKSWSAHYRIGVFFPHFYNSLSFRTAWLSNRFHRMIANWRTI